MRHSSEAHIVGFCVSAHAAVHICEQIFPAIAPLLVEQGVADLARVGDLGAIFPVFFGVLALPAGFLVDRIGSRRLLLGFLGVAGAAALIPLAAPGVPPLAVSLAVMGMAASLYHPAGLALLSKGTTESGRAFGLHGMGGSVGLALGPVLAGYVGDAFDWRYGFVVAAAPCLILAVYGLRHDLGEETVTLPESAPTAAATSADKSVMLVPILLLLGMGLFNGFAYRGFLTFSPLYLTDHFTQSFLAIDPVRQANGLVSFALFMGIWGQYAGGKWGDKYKEHHVIIWCMAGSVVAMTAMGALTNFGLAAAMIGLSFINFAIQPLGNKLYANFSGEGARGRIYGIAFFVNFGLSSIAPAFLGRLGERLGIEFIFYALAGCLAGGTLLAIALGVYAGRTAQKAA